MPYGLKEGHIKSIQCVFAGYPKVEEVIIFGSRAKGIHKPGSDIDLALKGVGLAMEDLLSLHNSLDGLDLPYTIELVIYDRITDPDVTDHIDRVGVVFFAKVKVSEPHATPQKLLKCKSGMIDSTTPKP